MNMLFVQIFTIKIKYFLILLNILLVFLKLNLCNKLLRIYIKTLYKFEIQKIVFSRIKYYIVTKYVSFFTEKVFCKSLSKPLNNTIKCVEIKIYK